MSTAAGGDAGHGSIFMFSPGCHDHARESEVIYNFTGGDDGDGPVGTLVRMHDGALVGVTQKGGSYGAGTIFMLTPPNKLSGSDKWVFRVIKPFCAEFYCLDGSGPNGNLTARQDGRFEVVLGTTAAGGKHGAGTLWKLVPGPHGDGFSVLQEFKEAGH